MTKLKYEPWHYSEIENNEVFEYVYDEYGRDNPDIFVLMRTEMNAPIKVGKSYKTPNNYVAELIDVVDNEYCIFDI